MKTHLVFLAAAAGFAAAVLACSDEETPGGQGGSGGGGETKFIPDLVVKGLGYGPHNGKRIFAIVTDSRNDAIVGERKEAVVQDGSFTFEWPGILLKGVPYNLDMFSGYDNDNDVCEPAHTDHVWRHPFRPDDRTNGVLNLTHRAAGDEFTDAGCEFFE